MIRSAIYVRSSKDLHNVSCETQEKELTQHVKEKGEAVYRVFCDQALSSTRDVRPQFDEMISLAMSKNPPFTKIYCLDTSRFGRDQHETQTLLYQLRRKHGIDVVFKNMPNTGTYLDPAFEAILSAFDYIHSQQSKAKGVASMKQNVINGYRAGGRAPYGYKLEQIEQGKHRSGSMIYKSRLVPDPQTAPFAEEYLMRRANFETRRSILDDFFRRGIPSPTGRESWPVASAKAIEDNIDVYLGHTVFNRHNERIKERGKSVGYAGGKKWREKSEWIITENTHQPLIGIDTAECIRRVKAQGLRDAPFNKQVYPLSGTLICSVCGTSYTGDKGIYRCNSKSKPGHECPNNGISRETVESAVFAFIGQKLLNFQNVKEAIEEAKRKLGQDTIGLKSIEARLNRIQAERERMMDLYRRGLADDQDIEKVLQNLNERRAFFESEIHRIKAVHGVAEHFRRRISRKPSEISTGLVKNGDPKIRKRVVQTLFDEIRISPKKGTPWERTLEIRGVYLPLTGVFVASPRGFEPLLPT